MGLALSTVKDFCSDLYSGEHPRGSSVTDRIGLLFSEDPGGCCAEEDGWDEGRRSSREASWVLCPPSSKLGAPALSSPATHSWLITVFSSAHKGGRLRHQETLGDTTTAAPSQSLTPDLSPLESVPLPTSSLPGVFVHTIRSVPLFHLTGLSSHTQTFSLQYLVIRPTISVFWSGTRTPFGTSPKKEFFSIRQKFSSKSGVLSSLQSPQSWTYWTSSRALWLHLALSILVSHPLPTSSSSSSLLDGLKDTWPSLQP